MANNKDFKVKNGLVAGGTIESTTGGIKFPDGTTQTTAVTASGEVNDLTSVVTWANVPDANITQSSVTQHEGALSITESQITDLGSYITASSTDTLTNKSGNISQWTNDSGYLTSFTETNDLSAAVTWANVPDANITQSSVTQHQAALSITESQISDLGTYAPIASPALTGTPTAPTAAASTNTTQIATTAYVQGELSSVSVAFDDLTGKASGTGTYSTTGYFTAGLNSGGVSLTHNDGGGNANVTFNHRSMTPEQTGNAGRIHVNTDLTSGASMQFQVGSGLTAGVSAGITTYFTIEENLLTANAAFKLLDSKELQLGTSNDLRMYHSSNINYFDLANGDLKIRDVSGTATDRFVFTQTGELGIGEDAPASKLHITEPNTSTYLATFQGDLGTNNGRVLRLKTPDTDSISEPFTWQTGNSIAWQVDASEAMRLDSVGNLGIGTPSPSTALEVSGTITSDEIQARVTSSGTTTGTLTASDANTKVTMTGDITVPNSTFATDDTIMFDGNGTDRTLTPASGLTIYVDGAAASSIDVGANKIIGLTFRSGTVAIATGVDATTSTTYLYSATSTDTTTNHNASFTPTVVDFDTELINQGSFTESGGRITVPIDGVYRVYGMVTYGRNTTEQRLSLQLQVHKNGTATGARGRGAYVRGQNNHDHASAYIEDFVDCSSGDILDVRAFQDAVSGTSVVQANQSRLLIQRIG